MGRLVRRSAEEKREIIHIVEHSELSVNTTLKELDVPRSSFYRWYAAYQEEGEDGLIDKRPSPGSSGIVSRMMSAKMWLTWLWSIRTSLHAS